MADEAGSAQLAIISRTGTHSYANLCLSKSWGHSRYPMLSTTMTCPRQLHQASLGNKEPKPKMTAVSESDGTQYRLREGDTETKP